MRSLPDCLRVSIPFNISHHRFGSLSTPPLPSSSLPSQHSQRQRVTVKPVYAKRSTDGKQRRPKGDGKSAEEQLQNGGNNNNAAAARAAPPPPRVQVHSLMDVRTQIRIVREVKKYEATAFRRTKPPIPQTYRKETKAPEEYRQERAAAEAVVAELSKNESKNFALSNLYRTADSSRVLLPPVLLVDGYNVLHKWQRTSSLMKTNSSGGYTSDGSNSNSASGSQVDVARDILIEALGVYSNTNGVRVIVAFDAMQGSAVGVEEQILSTGLTVAYTGNCEADSFIEAQVDFWLQRGHPSVVVATSDVAQKAVVDSKKGPNKKQIVFVVPASGLCKDIEATEKRLEQQLKDLEMRPLARGILGSAVKFKNKTAFSEMQKMRVVLPTASTLPELEKLKPKKSNSNNGGHKSGNSSSSSSSDEEEQRRE
jgi:predicted RNA-binding protein with PIN domain